MARGSPALRGFVHAFSRCHNSSISTAVLPTFLIPSIVQECPTLKSFHGSRHQEARIHASNQCLTDNKAESNGCSERGLPLQVERLISSSRRSKVAAWATIIESYLPRNLRLGAEHDVEKVSEEVVQHEALQPIDTLADVLSIARWYCKADLLSYVGVYQERWEAVMWLVKAMMEKYRDRKIMEIQSCQLPPIIWKNVDRNLDEVTEKAIESEMPQPSEMVRKYNRWYGGFSLDQYTGSFDSDHSDSPPVLGRKSLGQIWLSLGVMILQAADRPPEDTSYSVIMSHVFRILGHLHRIDALPYSIYNYSPPKDPTVLQRPPTLYVLSKRIMSTLSDVEWVIQYDEIIAKALSQGYELPKAAVQPRLREFGPELWLDLILWACVQGGWIWEGARIIIEMQKRRGSKNTQWSTVGWSKLCEVGSNPSFFSFLKREIEKARANQYSGLGMASGTNVQIDMGTRTISQEVVFAIIDGLLNDPPSDTKDFPMTAVELHKSLVACISLLECNDSKLDSNFMDTIILRVIESVGSVERQPGSLNRFLDLRPTGLKQGTSESSIKISLMDQEPDDSAAILGLYHRSLDQFSVEGNVEGSLGMFSKIQSTVDAQREGEILAFANNIKERLARGDDLSDLVGDQEENASHVQPSPIPVSALASFLDFVTHNRLFELGNWLLLNEDVDGGPMDPALYYDQNLQPAIFRFGTATSNSRILIKLLQGLETPLSEPVVHALLRFQVALGKWTAVEELLEYVKNTPDMAWEPSDATSIAKAVLQMEHKPPDNNVDVEMVSRALSLLQNLIHGKYNSKADPSRLRPDFSQLKTANQLGRILQTLPGSLKTITTKAPQNDLRAHASVDISPFAFNILLETIVDQHGSLAGKKLWDEWCRVPNVRRREQEQLPPSFDSKSGGSGEKVVTPTLFMLRGVLRPVLETRRALNAARKDELSSKNKQRSLKGAAASSSSSSLSSSSSSDDDQQKEHGLSAAADPTDNNNNRNDNNNHTNDVEDEKRFRLGDEDQAVVEWGVRMYREFGLLDEEIDAEIPGSLGRWNRQKKKKRVERGSLDKSR